MLEAALTEFFIEGETLEHALVHQCLFCRAVWDQLVPLGLKLTLQLREETRNLSHLKSDLTILDSLIISVLQIVCNLTLTSR